MRIRITLLYWLFRQALPVTAIALPTACLYVLFRHEPFIQFDDFAVTAFICIHSAAIVFRLGRFRSSGFAFLHTRGYSRTTLWAHSMLATALAVLAVYLPVVIILCTPIRSTYQEYLARSPYFPILAPREWHQVINWVGMYLVLLPIFHYAWIRRAQPTRGLQNGSVLASAFVFAGLVILSNIRFPAVWFNCLLWSAGALVALAAFIGGFRLYQRIEVRV